MAPLGQHLCALHVSRRVSPSRRGPLYSRIGTLRSCAASDRTPSGSTNLKTPAPASTVFQPCASPCTRIACAGSNAGRTLLAIFEGSVHDVAAARAVELLPRCRDVLGLPLRLVDSRGQTAIVRQWAPEGVQRCGNRLEDTGQRQVELLEIPAESLEEHRRRGFVDCVEQRASSPCSELVDQHAAVERLALLQVERHRHLQDALPAGMVGGNAHVRRRPAANGAPRTRSH